ncbi:MAG TPA: apolipoprotein N-acyltransferase [Bacteroidota bacterium]|nr:apolipoprotein N-acyltransferase [Bacteroidota bacterium]
MTSKGGGSDRHQIVRIPRGDYYLAALSGALLGFSFPPFRTGLLACVGLVPLLVAMAHRERLSHALRLAYVAMLVFHLITLNWTGGYVHGNDPYMMIAGAVTMIFHPLFYLIPLGLYHAARKWLGENPALVALPFLWVGYEYSHSLSEWSFPWLTIGNSQSFDLSRIQFISFTGIWGLSLWILLINVLTYLLYAELASRRWTRRAAWLGALILAVGLLPTAEGLYVLSGAPAAGLPGPGKPVTVGIVQSNVDPWDKWARQGNELVSLYTGMTHRLTSDPAGPRPSIVLWPETAITGWPLLPGSRPLLEALRSDADTMGVSILTGIDHAVVYADPAAAPASARTARVGGERYDTYNAAAFIQPHVERVDWYGKMKMVPIAERVPYADMFAFLDFLRWGVGIGGWQIGPRQTVFRDSATGVSFSSLICYESTYPGFVASFVRKGASFLALITIDSWWGKMSGAFQHRQFAVFRAVENRRWIARCAVGGISCFIDPYGRSYDDTELFTVRTIARTIAASDELTFYTRHGDWLGMCALLGACMCAAAVAGRKFMNRTRRTLWTTST